MNAPSKSPWRDRVTTLTVLYMMLERGETFSTLLEGDKKFVEPTLDRMYRNGYLTISGAEYAVTPKGQKLRDSMVALYDQALQFEIFGAVNIDAPNDPNDAHPEMPGLVVDNIYDPRFKEGPNSVDMRLAMLDFLGETLVEQLGGKKIDPYVIVFMQKLADGELQAKDFWYKLRSGEFFGQIEQIVDSAYNWRSASEDENEARAFMRTMYQAGLCEERKRSGDECGQCGTVLGMFDYHEQQAGRKLTECPNPDCKRKLAVGGEPIGTEYQCPNCGGGIHRSDRSCAHCNAVVNFHGVPGSVSTETTVETEVTYEPLLLWSAYPVGYMPCYHYYDPFDPFAVGMVAGFGCGLAFEILI